MSKAIIVTGGSRGIGAAVARQAGQRGWNVVVNFANNERAAGETVAAVEKAGGKALAVRGDVASEADVTALFAAAAAAFGTIDGVVNNAGVVAPAAQVADQSLERWRRLIDINIVGSWLVAREGVRRMAKSRGGQGGSIVNISSAAARLGGAGEYVDYASTKGAIDAFTLGLAREVGGDGVRVNAVRPGVTETDIHASGGEPGRAARIGSTTPFGRAGTADEVAAAVIWLLSDEASYVSGAILDVSGGR